MPLTITSLDQLDPAQVLLLQAEFSQLVAERHPEVRLAGGAFHDLVAYFAGGVRGAVTQAEIDRVLRSRSLLEIEQDPELADEELVDHVLSNYRITRHAGTHSVGDVTLVVSADVSLVVPAGLVFTAAGGVQFVTDAAILVKPTNVAASSPNERTLTELGGGAWACSVPVVAVEPGQAGNIRRGTQLTPASAPARYVSSHAARDFTGGSDTELNAALLTRLNEGIAAKVLQGRANIKALLREQEDFANLLECSVIGFGQAEMPRDQRGIIPISGGGRLDLYVRTELLPRSVPLTKEATLIEVTGDGGVWQLSVAREDAPGFYEVDRILLPSDLPDAAGFEVLEDLRGLDLPAEAEGVPDLISATEAAYTAYQTAVIRFLDTQTSTSGLTVGSSKQDYVVSLAAMPLIQELQEFCMDREHAHLAADVAVKAPVPCFLTVNFDVRMAPETEPPDVEAIRADLAETVNRLGFPGQLHASLVHEVVHRHLAERQAVGRVDLHGRIRRPDGATRFIRASDILSVPADPGAMVSGRTVAFLLDPERVGVSLVVEGYTTGV